MKFCFCSLIEADDEEVISKSRVRPTLSSSNFNKKMANGFYDRLGNDLKVICTSSVASFPGFYKILNRKEKFNVGQINCTRLFFINLPVFKYITEAFSMLRELLSWYKSHKGEEMTVCSYGRRPAHVWAISRLKRRHPEIKILMIFGDLSGEYRSKTSEVFSWKEKMVNRILSESIHIALRFDGCVFLTEQMSEVLKPKNPYIVMEGMCEQEILEINSKREKYIKPEVVKVIYTGVISKQYHVDTLVNAFRLLDEKKYMLLLYGDGPFTRELKRMKEENIRYMGVVDSEKIKEIQFDADILVNPRQNGELYTKYSFPSKILEYLATGNPVIAYKLDGVPKEYDSLLYYVEDNSEAKLADKIRELGDMSIEARSIYRSRVFDFLRSNKTESIQCQKIIDYAAAI